MPGGKRVDSREQLLTQLSTWLDDAGAPEADLDEGRRFEVDSPADPDAAASDRSGEPDGLSRDDIVDARLSKLVRRALQEGIISLGRDAEILGLSREDMRQRIREWAT